MHIYMHACFHEITFIASLAIHGSADAGISAGKTLWEAGVRDLLILEATGRVGGRMHKHNFGGINVEIGANWVEGLGGDQLNPIWPLVNSTLKLRNFYSDFDSVVGNVYKEKYVYLFIYIYTQRRNARTHACTRLMIKT
jgi:polyamine oxidase